MPTLNDPISTRAITWRSVTLGLLGAITINVVSPYNDFVVSNGFTIACYLPVIVVFLLFLIAIYNGLCRIWVPAAALSTPELGVVTMMLLVSCSIPCQGFLRAFLPTLIHPFYHGRNSPDFWRAFTSMGLPQWMFPVGPIEDGRASRMVDQFYDGRVQGSESIPYGAWVLPICVWMIFFGALMATVVALAMLVFPQWAQNERLAFPIAQVEMALIEAPEPGHSFNALFRSRVFWIAAMAVLVIHSLGALHSYFPRVPFIQVGYDLRGIMTEEPWNYLNNSIKANQIYFTFIGMAFFIQTRASFSIWFLFIAIETIRMMLQWQAAVEVPDAAMSHENMGASVVLLGGIFWVGRNYWLNVARNALGEYRGILSMLGLGIAIMLGWLMYFGVSPAMALLIVACLLMAHILVSRIVAETGLPFIRSFVTPEQFYMPYNMPVSTRDVYFGQVFAMNGAFETRESLMTFSQHGLRVWSLATDGLKRYRAVGVLIAVTLVVSIFSGTWSSLYSYYTYTTPLTSRNSDAFINPHGAGVLPKATVVTPMENVAKQAPLYTSPHDPTLHLALGAGITLVLMLCAYRYAGWPLLPIGFVIVTSGFYINTCWISVAVGWLCKELILRLGGASLFNKARPVFIGLILGEVLAYAVWLVVNLVLALLGYDYVVIQLLPS